MISILSILLLPERVTILIFISRMITASRCSVSTVTTSVVTRLKFFHSLLHRTQLRTFSSHVNQDQERMCISNTSSSKFLQADLLQTNSAREILPSSDRQIHLAQLHAVQCCIQTHLHSVLILQ